MRKTIALPLFCIAALAATAQTAHARERIVVLMIAGADQALGDNLAEVAISRLGEGGDHEFVAMRELRGRLPATVAVDALPACAEQPACLAQIAAAAGAARVVVGVLRRTDDAAVIELRVANGSSGVIEAERSREVAGGVESLITAVQDLSSELLAANAVAPPRPVAVVTPAVPGPTPAVPAMALAPPVRPIAAVAAPPALEHRTPTSRYLAYGLAALAVVAFSAAAATGTVASGKAAGSSRLEAQQDLERRGAYAAATNGLLIGGGALAIGATISFAR